MAEPSPIEVRTSAGSTHVGQLEYTSEFEETIANAEKILALLGRQRVFERQRSVDYQFLVHFESAAEWQEYFEYWASYYDPVPEGLMQSIENLASVPGAEIVLDTKCQSTTFKKPG
ncbi:MAG: hypothetical protein ACE1ZA_15095 [Pseudomonadales bacterium]